MRLAPTSRYLILATASVVGAVLFGCATDNGDAHTPTEAQPPNEPDKTDDTEHPTFDASIAPAPDGGVGGDPTPPDGDQCLDPDDPGSAENVAKVLPDTDDCDNNFKSVTGVAKGMVDVDFFKLSGTDKNFCSLDTDFEAVTAGMELCVFARCTNSTAEAVTGCSAGVAATSDIGMKGCCVAGPGHAVPEWDCSGIGDDDSADFYIRVKQVNADKCLAYKFNYRY